MNLSPRIFVAGHQGMVGSAIVRQILNIGHPKNRLITKTRSELDLIKQTDVNNFFCIEKPDHVYLAAAKVGGIHANNTYPADFIYENLMIETNVIDAAFRSGVKKLLFLGSSCIYPKIAIQPMKENALLTGSLEPTNEPYAIAKIAGIKMCESYNRQYGRSHGIDYRSLMPTNLFGLGDNYHSINSHVIPSLIRRFHEAKVKSLDNIVVWGSGNQMREFLYVDDLADASIFLMNVDKTVYNNLTRPMLSHINVGSGYEIKISSLAKMIAEIVGFKGNIMFDKSMPDGPLRKSLDSTLIKSLSWKPKVGLKTGIDLAYKDFLNKNGQ